MRTWRMVSKTRYPPNGNFNQLVTDGAGNVGWAPRLAYSYSEYVNFEQDGDLTPEFSSYSFDGMFNRWYDDFYYSLKANAEYVVTFDGEEYWCTPISYRDSEMGYDATVLGNASLIKKGSPMAPIIKDDTGEPFVFYTYQNGGSSMTLVEASTDGEHTISIKAAEETASQIDPKYIPAMPSVPLYGIPGENLTRAQALKLIKAGQPFQIIETENPDGANNIKMVSCFVAQKSGEGEDGETYSAEIYGADRVMSDFKLVVVNNPTDAEVEEVQAAWLAKAQTVT